MTDYNWVEIFGPNRRNGYALDFVIAAVKEEVAIFTPGTTASTMDLVDAIIPRDDYNTVTKVMRKKMFDTIGYLSTRELQHYWSPGQVKRVMGKQVRERRWHDYSGPVEPETPKCCPTCGQVILVSGEDVAPVLDGSRVESPDATV